MPGIVVASFNIHAGVDGWGRPFDATDACAALDTDVLVLQEDWRPEGERGLAAEIGDALGYDVRTVTLARAVLYPPSPANRPGWGPPPWSRQPVGLRVLRAGAGPGPGAGAAGRPVPRPLRGDWGIAVLSRLPVIRDATLDLGQLRRDPAHRQALEVEVDAGHATVTIVGVHMSHMKYGSTIQFRRLARQLGQRSTDGVLLGDMNIWSLPLQLLLPAWRGTVRGRTWPAWRPLAQIDHILVRPGTRVTDPAVIRLAESDHRAVKARIHFG